MERTRTLALLNGILASQGKPETGEDATLQDAGFRSLDFSELALRAELEAGAELNFEASELRAIETVGDVLDFFERALP